MLKRDAEEHRAPDHYWQADRVAKEANSPLILWFRWNCNVATHLKSIIEGL